MKRLIHSTAMIVTCTIATALLSSAPIESSAIEADPYATVRGMTISCPGSGRIWGTDAMVETMRELKAMGVNWVTIHPYAGIRSDGSVIFQGGRRNMYDDPVWLTRPIEEAHRLGLKIMIKPHLAYWGSPFAWRGEITFETDDEWNRFFDTYETWITRVAELARDADAFIVGTELEGTTHHEARWRYIIDQVRAKTSAPLTYSANWDRYETITFWDALDVIGIQCYFPLVAHDQLPHQRELDDAWARLIRDLETYSTQHDRRIVFGELGYNRSANAAVRPWESRQGGEHAEEVQRRCLTAALKALQSTDRICGAFLWKWFPDSGGSRNVHHHEDFLMQTAAMREVISVQWRAAE